MTLTSLLPTLRDTLPVRDTARGVVGTATLPTDLHAGDLVAVPCPGCFSVGDVRPRAGR